MTAEEIVLSVRRGAVVRVGGGTEAEFIGVVAPDILQRQAVLEGLATVAANQLVDAPLCRRQSKQNAQDCVVGEFIVRRQQRVSLGLALHLRDFDQPFVAHARFGPGGVNGAAHAVHIGGVHPAVGQVGVVGNGQQFVARLALGVHPLPQLFRMPRIECRIGCHRHLGAVTEKDIAVQVAVRCLRSPLVGTKCRELAGFIGGIGDTDVFLPDRPGDFGLHELLDGRLRKQTHHRQEGALLLLLAVGIGHDQALDLGQFAGKRTGCVSHLADANVLGVVGDTHKVQRCINLDVVTEGVLDGLAPGVLVGVGRPGEFVTEQPGVRRPTGVQVGLAEVGIALGVGSLSNSRACAESQGCHDQG